MAILRFLTAALLVLPPALPADRIEVVPFTAVEVRDEFWSPWLRLNEKVILPHNLRLIEETQVIDNFRRAAGQLSGPAFGMKNSDEVLYKAIEAASYVLATKKDPALDGYVDQLVARIAAAQEPDGYIMTYKTVNLKYGQSPNEKPRLSDLHRDHELYLFGHLYEAAVAHYQATGKRALLDVAVKNADMVDRLYGEGKRREVDGHPNVEQALVRLFEVTGEKRYLRLAEFFVTERGHAHGRKLMGENCQDHMPILEQREIVGQAPRATYLFSGVADVVRHTGDPGYRAAMERLWENAVTRKMYITGGVGSQHSNEGFGPEYELPNGTAYTETCAAVSFSMWNHRMFLLAGESNYIDILERTLYNNFLAGTGLSGDQFFYANPLESDGATQFNRGWMSPAPGLYKDASATRKRWFFCACCPPNVARLFPWMPAYIYARSGGDLFVNLFVGGSARTTLNGTAFAITQQSRYPWEGSVRIGVTPERPAEARIRVRIPGWAEGRPVPGDLYRYMDQEPSRVNLRINGRPATFQSERGYAVIRRRWKAGDTIELDLSMPVHRVVSHPNVKANAGRVALERGPLVYCFEGADNGGKVLTQTLSDRARIRPVRRKDLLGGVTVLEAAKLTAIPYYAWSNRGAGEMVVWVRRADR